MATSLSISPRCTSDWRRYLATGEKAKVMVISQDRGQAKVILDYAKGLLHAVPMLERLIESETTQSVSLTNRVVIEVHAASFRSTRGFTLVAVLLDECAFFPTDERRRA